MADEIVAQRICRDCNLAKPFSEYYPAKERKDGYRRECKECAKQLARAWNRANPEKVRAKNSRYFTKERNRERARELRGRLQTDPIKKAKMLQWRRDAYHARHKYHDQKPEIHARIIERKRKLRAANPEKERERQRKWHHSSGKGIEKIHRRRARIANAPIVERISRGFIIARDGSRCYLWCGRILSDKEIVLDHVVPLSRGGEHSHRNLRVACRPCNTRKSDWLLSELPNLTMPTLFA